MRRSCRVSKVELLVLAVLVRVECRSDRLETLLRCRGHLFELFDSLGWLLVALLEVGAIDLRMLSHELAFASKGLLCCAPVH